MKKTLFFQFVATVLAACVVVGCSAEAKKTRTLKKADGYFQAGELEKAKIEYLNVLNGDPENRAAIEKLGLIWVEQGSPVRAFPFLLKMRELDPNNYALRTKLARIYLNLGKISEARQEATAILQKSSEDEALILLTETIRTPAELEATQKALREFPDAAKAAFHLATARFLLRKRDVPGSQRSVDRVLASDPKSADAHTVLAALHLRQGKPDLAAEELKQAADLSPVRSEKRLNYIDFLLLSGATEKATACVNDFIAKAPDYLPARRVLAQIKYLEKKYDESQALLKQVLGRDPSNPEALLMQALIWVAQGEMKKAIDRLELLSTHYPGLPVVSHTLARAYLQNSQVGKAEAALIQSLRHNPEHVESVLLLAEIRLRSGDFQVVTAEMIELLKVNPFLVKAQDFLIEALQSGGQVDLAEKVIREKIRVFPKNPDAQLVLGRLLRQQNKLKEARTSIEKSLELSPDSFAAFTELVSLDIAEKNFTAAMERVAAKKTNADNSPALMFEEARIHSAQKKWPEAETASLKLLEAEPSFGRAYDLLGNIYVASNRRSEGIVRLKEMLAKNPDNERALELTAVLYTQLKDHDHAREAFEKILARNPDNAVALNNLACLYYDQLGQPDKGFELAEKAWALAPYSAAIADTLGWMLYRREDFKKALPLLQESGRKAPKESEIQFHFAMALEKNGDTEPARVAFRRALSGAADFDWKAEAQKRLAALDAEAEKKLAPVTLESTPTATKPN